MCRAFFFPLCFVFVSFAQTSTKNQHLDIIQKAPPVFGTRYQAKAMVEVVNHLRGLGKDKSLALLRDYLTSGGLNERVLNNDRVLIICRLLFVNPKGWNQPGRGRPVPLVNQDAAKRFPLFPIGLSDRVPFLLIQGYELVGRGEDAADCLKLCEDFALVSEDYLSSDHRKAARSLVAMDSFRQLYAKEDLPDMIEMVLDQAKAKPVEK